MCSYTYELAARLGRARGVMASDAFDPGLIARFRAGPRRPALCKRLRGAICSPRCAYCLVAAGTVFLPLSCRAGERRRSIITGEYVSPGHAIRSSANSYDPAYKALDLWETSEAAARTPRPSKRDERLLNVRCFRDRRARSRENRSAVSLDQRGDLR